MIKQKKSNSTKEVPRERISLNNVYKSGVCKVCGNDYINLEIHYSRYPTHRPN